MTEVIARVKRVSEILKQNNISAIVISSNVNIFYILGRLILGYIIIDSDGNFVVLSKGNEKDTVPFSKPSEILNIATDNGLAIYDTISIEDDYISASDYLFLSKCFSDKKIINSAKIMRAARIIKTPLEISLIKESANLMNDVYAQIPSLYKENMTDQQFSIEIEHLARQKGHLGVFRTYGNKMECFMGTVLVGDNAAYPSPFDFALGGKGCDSSLPIGACNSKILRGQSIMVDISGNKNGYLADMTRVFSYGALPERAIFAHNVSNLIHSEIMKLIEKGTTAKECWLLSVDIAKENGLLDCYMGISKRAKFVGHGLGIEINELPVLTERDETKIENGMAIAIEPKFIIEGVGAVGNEDTYIIEGGKANRVTTANRDIILISNKTIE